MNKLRICIAILVGKLLIVLSRMLGNQGTDFPGKMALKIFPSLLKTLAGNINQGIIMVTGTNGKTTTTNMLAQILKSKAYSLVHNQAGANMLSGITTAFIAQSNLSGSKQFDYALLETDEANVPLLLKETKPQYLLITNFFRDQLDRYGELDHTINLIKRAVQDTGVKLLLNADDPLTAHFQKEGGLQRWYYGFDNTGYDSCESSESREGRYCVLCGCEIDYKLYHYAQLGQYSCPGCKNHNPERDFTAHDLEMSPAIELAVNETRINSPYQGFFNAYNILAAVSMAKLLGIEEGLIQQAIAAFEPQAGRMESFRIKGKRVVLILVKNPTGLNQSLAALGYDRTCKNVFIALNDNAADGRDISWIWDADVEMIATREMNIENLVCSGQRSGDIAVRIKYAGVPENKINIQTGLKEGIELAINLESECSYILSTYTALFECRKILVKLQKQYGGGEEQRSLEGV